MYCYWLFRLLPWSVVAWCSSVHCQEAKPKIEVGVGLVSQVLADYRGSKRYSAQALPIPYVLYRGKIFKVDRGGVRGEFLQRNRYELNVSLDASLGGNDDQDNLRAGMPELDSTLEIGPSLDISLTGTDLSQGLSLRLPVRAVFAVGSHGIDSVGYLFNPRLTWRKPNAWGGLRVSSHLGLLWADSTYHSYYYDVDSQYTQANRPAYDAGAGYSGTFIKMSLYKQVKGWRLGTSLRYDNLSGTVFNSSPLVETSSYVSLSLGITRRLWTSAAQ